MSFDMNPVLVLHDQTRYLKSGYHFSESDNALAKRRLILLYQSVNYLWDNNACKYHADFSMARYAELSDFQFYSYR